MGGEEEAPPPCPAPPASPLLRASSPRGWLAGWGKRCLPLARGPHKPNLLNVFIKPQEYLPSFASTKTATHIPAWQLRQLCQGAPHPPPTPRHKHSRASSWPTVRSREWGSCWPAAPSPETRLAGWLAAGGGSPHPAHTVNPPRQPVLVPQNRSPPAARLSAPTSAGLPNWSPSRLCPRRKRRSWSCWSPSWSCWR